MLDRQTSPLEIAERVLQAETLRLIAEAKLSLSAEKLLDKWALNDPDALRELETEGGDVLLQRVQEHANIEDDILHSESARRAREYGYSDYEIMQEMGPPVGTFTAWK